MRLGILATFFALAASAVSQNHVWNQEGQDRYGTNRALYGPDPATYTTPWIYKRFFGFGIASGGTAIQHNGVGYYGTWVENRLRRIDVLTGTVTNYFPASDFVQSTPALSPSGDAIYIHCTQRSPGTPPGRLFRVNAATMDFDWAHDTGFAKFSDYEAPSPTVAPGGDVIIGSRIGRLWRLDDQTGTVLWEVVGLDEVLSTAVFSRSNATIFVAHGNKISAVAFGSGHIYWTKSYPSRLGAPGVAPDGTVVFGSFDGTVFGISPTTGVTKWSRSTGGTITASPAFSADGKVYVGSYDRRVYAYNTGDGVQQWSFLTTHELRSSPCVDSAGRILVHNRTGGLYCINPNGLQVWNTNTGGESRGQMSIGKDGTIYLGVNSQSIGYAMIKQTAIPEMRFTSLSMSAGILTGGGVGIVHKSDNFYASLKTPNAASVIQADLQMSSPYKKMRSFMAKVETQVSIGPDAVQTVEFYDNTTSSYVVVDSRAGTIDDSVVDLNLVVNATRFVNGSSGLIRMRIKWTSGQAPGWTAKIDEARLLKLIPAW